MIYLDHAATSWPKPERVVRATMDALRKMTSPGRGISNASELAEATLFDLRTLAGAQFDCSAECVVLTSSATHGLNIAIKSLVSPGDRVVVSGVEHNAVMRPLTALGAEIHVAGSALFDDEILVSEFDRLLTKGTKACIMTHVSNVFGWILPAGKVAELCWKRGIPFVLDASQSAGILPISMAELHAAFVAMPGHKGLMGPQGTGLLLVGHETKTLMEGGTGSVSKHYEMPDFLPDRLEPGTPNIPGAAGLKAGIETVRSVGLGTIQKRETALANHLKERFRDLDRIQVYSGAHQSGVVSFRVEGMDTVLLAEKLWENRNIALRAGFHCAPLAHQTAGTLETGTVRVSFGKNNTLEEAEILFRAVRNMTRTKKL